MIISEVHGVSGASPDLGYRKSRIRIRPMNRLPILPFSKLSFFVSQFPFIPSFKTLTKKLRLSRRTIGSNVGVLAAELKGAPKCCPKPI